MARGAADARRGAVEEGADESARNQGARVSVKDKARDSGVQSRCPAVARRPTRTGGAAAGATVAGASPGVVVFACFAAAPRTQRRAAATN